MASPFWGFFVLYCPCFHFIDILFDVLHRRWCLTSMKKQPLWNFKAVESIRHSFCAFRPIVFLHRSYRPIFVMSLNLKTLTYEETFTC